MCVSVSECRAGGQSGPGRQRGATRRSLSARRVGWLCLGKHRISTAYCHPPPPPPLPSDD